MFPRFNPQYFKNETKQTPGNYREEFRLNAHMKTIKQFQKTEWKTSPPWYSVQEFSKKAECKAKLPFRDWSQRFFQTSQLTLFLFIYLFIVVIYYYFLQVLTQKQATFSYSFYALLNERPPKMLCRLTVSFAATKDCRIKSLVYSFPLVLIIWICGKLFASTMNAT